MTLNFCLPGTVVLGSRSALPSPVLYSAGNGAPNSNYTSTPAQQSHLNVCSILFLSFKKQKTYSPTPGPLTSHSGKSPEPHSCISEVYWDYHIVMINISLGKLLWGEDILCAQLCAWVYARAHGCVNVGLSPPQTLAFCLLEVSYWPEAHWLANKPNRFTCLCLPSPKITNTYQITWRLCLGSVDQNQALLF